MGLTASTVGFGAYDAGLTVQKRSPDDKVIALAGNPNVGKSTIFNALTGMHQHTGNWTGKTVSAAQGYCTSESHGYVLVDIPGTYSLLAHSAEEEVARNFICFGKPDAVIVVCDATCLERNLNLVLQTMEIAEHVIVCVNLMDEARRKGITPDLSALSQSLGIPVVGTTAQDKKTLINLLNTLDQTIDRPTSRREPPVRYPQAIEDSISLVQSALDEGISARINPRWLSLKLLEHDNALLREADQFLGRSVENEETVRAMLRTAEMHLQINGIGAAQLKQHTVPAIVQTAERLAQHTVTYEHKDYNRTDRRIDRILTSKATGYPLMMLLLLGVFWITIAGANYPSQLLSDTLFGVQDLLSEQFVQWGAPQLLHDVLIRGVYRVLAWVVSVMLPPMAIFFPLFTLLEDAGYLPRVAYNLDKPFHRCRACGKQSLTMAMGFGCNAAGVTGCRIIDSPRERLLAILTNSFVPCNGRFPTILAVITMFFVGTQGGFSASFGSALFLTVVILLGIAMTFAATRLLSATVLKGVPSAYTLELPSYRRPQVGKVLIRSLLDRTLFVLGRAVMIAIPAGLIIWLSANITISGTSLLSHCAAFLDPFAQLMGLDGMILMAFLLGLPANEIVVPILLMGYLAQGELIEMDSLAQMRQLLVENGWTQTTAVCMILFSLMHWPCSTTLMTIRKETGSWKWTLLSLALPTAFGILGCMLVNGAAHIFL